MCSKKILKDKKMQIFMELGSLLLRGNGGGDRGKGRGCAGQGGDEKPLNDLYFNSEHIQYYYYWIEDHLYYSNYISSKFYLIKKSTLLS